MNILITGATGFVGRHLIDLLQGDANNTVYGTSMDTDTSPFIKVDLRDYDQVKTVINRVKPDVIYHLAAFSSPALSFEHPLDAVNDTLAMQINITEACMVADLHPRVIIVSSGQIYGKAKASDLPLKEETPLDLASPYAVAKVGQENLAAMYAKRGVESVIARPFNHIGPGQQPGFLVASLCQQIATVEKTEGANTLSVGNLHSKRDFTDVRDIVRAYTMLAKRGKPGRVYNICSGKAESGAQILNILLSFSTKKIMPVEDPKRMRPSDIPVLFGDSSRLHSDTGWTPEIPLRQTLEDTLTYWRERV